MTPETITIRIRTHVVGRLREAGAQDDGSEVSGWLFGVAEPNAVRVTDLVLTPSDRDDRSAYHATLRGRDALEVWAQLPPEVEVLGSFHTHSSDEGPSDRDYECWRRMADAWGIGVHVGILLEPDAYRVCVPRAFVAYRDGEFVFDEPAEIEED